jgi:hypothetical protein
VTKCPPVERLAAAASGEDELVALHAEVCDRCGPLLAEPCDAGQLVRRLPAPPLVGDQRRTLAALVAAGADRVPPPRRSRWPIVAAVMVGVAAVAAVVATLPAHEEVRDPIALAPAPPPPVQPPAPPPVKPPPPPKPPEIVATAADYTRLADRVKLRTGTLAIDARERTPVVVVAGDAALHVDNSKLEITARAGMVATVHVFAGSVELVQGSRRTMIVAGDVWEAPRPVTAAPPPIEAAVVHPDPPTPAEVALAEFRAGWTALRDGHRAEAIAAFDRATDLVVAEDASYWAAVACERDGQLAEALRRFRAFLAAFPTSPRIDAARAAIQRLGP